MKYLSAYSSDIDIILRECGIQHPSWGHAVLAGWIFFAKTGDIEVTLDTLRHAYWLVENNEEAWGGTVKKWLRFLITTLYQNYAKEV